MKRITVLLVDDNRAMREGFRKLLELEDDLEVVGEADNGLQAIEIVKEIHPAVVLMDVAMPLLNGLHATRRILEVVPGTRVLMLSTIGDDGYVGRASAYGAMGDLLKQTCAGTMCDAIREVQKLAPAFDRTIRPAG
ncbi:LuxR family transcriptional regulator (fragment) [Verrucomicrobia bacterium]